MKRARNTIYLKAKLIMIPSPVIAGTPPAATLAAGFEADLKHAAGDGADGSWRFRLGWSPAGGLQAPLGRRWF